MVWVIGLDLGGTNIKAAVVNEQGEIAAHKQIETWPEEAPAAIIDRMAGLAADLRRETDLPVAAIGAAIPGLLDAERGISVHSPNLGWRMVDVRSPLQEKTGLPVYNENDLRLGALGEWRFGAGRGTQHMVFVPLGTGVGAGIICHGTLVTGGYGFAGELGHVPVPYFSDAVCGCGQTGCLETVVSATGLVRLARAGLEAALSRREDGVTRAPLYLAVQGDVSRITAEQVAESAKAGDPWAGAAWQTMCDALGWALAMLVNLLNPEKAVVGGGVSAAGNFLLDPVREALHRYAMPGLRDRIELMLAALGSRAGVLGAAALALERLGATGSAVAAK